MVNGISILGSTGSIGRQTVAAAKHLGVPVKAISVQSNIELAERQARELNTELVKTRQKRFAGGFVIQTSG